MNWQSYIRASWEIVIECESRSQVSLDEEMEAYLVHMMARNFRRTDFPPSIMCLEFTRARTPEDFRQIGEFGDFHAALAEHAAIIEAITDGNGAEAEHLTEVADPALSSRPLVVVRVLRRFSRRAIERGA